MENTVNNNTGQVEKCSNETNDENKNDCNQLTHKSYNEVIKELEKGVVYDDLPRKEPSEIRIFLSSTFKDFKFERNYLIEHIYEPLRKFCNEQYQKDFILIDMRWGITDEVTNQNVTEEICLNEIDKCKNESVGPYFVCFLSHRYGTKFLKSTILENEFELIRTKASKQIPYKQITSLLDYFYELDQNNINNRSYKLKNKNEIMQGLKLDDKDEWNRLSDMLIDQIRKAADSLYSSGTISELERDKYFISVTEQEIEHGLLKENNPNRKCVAFFRNIITDKSAINRGNKNLKTFIEDQEGESQLNRLKDLVDKKISSNQNKRSFQIEWNQSNEFKEPYTNEIREYLTEFGDAFHYIVTTLIKDNMNDIWIENTELDVEILHHALLCTKLNKQSIRRDHLTRKVQLYLDDESNRKPFIVFGTSGSGKSTILAYTIKHLKGKNDVFIYRFMGTSRESSNMKSIMLSILRQLENIYEDCDKGILEKIQSSKQDQETDFETIPKLKERFIKMLQKISTKTDQQKLVIVLDSIDQLSKADYSLEWFIYDLPKNVKMIYSVIPDYSDILNKLKDKLEFIESNYLEIDKLYNNKAKEMVENWLSNVDRNLTGTLNDKSVSTQWSFLNELLSKTPQIYPLHIRIIFDIVSKWPSWYKVENEFKSCISIKDTIKYLFKGLETFHGQILFSRCVFYLTLFEYSGISEAELEDILSIDDELLNSVFVHHHPPVRRFQIALWLKIKYDLKDYITNKETDGVSVISWFHRSFIEASNEYYEDMFNVGDVKDKLLMNVVDYFTEKYNEIRSNGSKGIKKEFEYKKKKIHNFEEINENLYAAYRCTKVQKIKSIKTNMNKDILVYNKRKLNELVNVISMMQDNLNKVELLKEHVYFNYEFMHAKCELKELNFIFEMDPIIRKLSRRFNNDQKIHELSEINEIYKHVYPKLVRQDPNLLNIEILSRLSDNKSHYVEGFQKHSGLKMISRRFLENETVRDLFVGDSLFKINKFYEQFNGNLLFIESIRAYSERGEFLVKDKRIDVIHSRTSKYFGSIPLNKEAHIQIGLNNENTNELNELTELNGFIYFSNGDSLFNYSFSNNSFNLINSFKTKIDGLLLLNSTHLLVVLADCFFLLNLQNVNDHGKQLIEPTFRENNEIQFIESTIPKETVFNSQYLDGVDSISIIVGFKDSNLIKIYKFSHNNNQKLSLLCTIDSLKWSFYGFIVKYMQIWRESLLIDESYMIDNMSSTKLNRVLVKFALQHEGVTKIIEVNDKGEFNVVDEINENIFGIDDEERYEDKDDKGRTLYKAEVELDSFKNDKILFKLRCSKDRDRWYNIYLYNIEKKSVVSKIKTGDRVNAYLQHGIIVGQFQYKLKFYKINDDETINELSTVKISSAVFSNEIKGEMKIKNGKLLRIEPEERTSFRLSIKAIDYLYESKVMNSNGLIRVNWDSRMHEIDERHILVQEGKESKFSIVEVNDQKIVKTGIMEGGYRLIGYKNGFLVLFNERIEELIVYKIENKQDKQDSFEFKQIFKQQVQGIKYNSYVTKCHFNELKPKRFIITLYDKPNDKIEVRFMEEYDENKLNVSTSTVSLNNIQLEHFWISCLFTSLNEYLVIYQYVKRIIYLIDITCDKIIDSIEMDQAISLNSVESILNSNDLIVGCEKSLNYIKYDINSNKCNKIKLKNYQQRLWGIEIKHEYLFVILEDSMEIYKLDDKLKNNNELSDPIRLVKRVEEVQISTNKEYLIVFFRDKELCVYKFDNFYQIASLYLNVKICHWSGIVSNEDYISFRLEGNSSLITFKLTKKT